MEARTLEAHPALHGLVFEVGDVTTIWLRDRLSIAARIGRVLLGLIGVACMVGALRSYFGAGAGSVTPAIVLAIVAGAFGVFVWAIGSSTRGLRLTITPGRIRGGKHWSQGGTTMDVDLATIVTLGETDGKLVIAHPWGGIVGGSALTEEGRAAVLSFLGARVAAARAAGAIATIRPGQRVGTEAPDEPQAREYLYRTPPVRATVGVLLLAAGTCLFGWMALTNDRGMIINGIIPLSREVATILYWAFAVACLIGAGTFMKQLWEGITASRRIVLSPDRIELRHDGYPAGLVVEFASLIDFRVAAVDGGVQASMVLVHPLGSLTIERSKLSRDSDFEVVRDWITRALIRLAPPAPSTPGSPGVSA